MVGKVARNVESLRRLHARIQECVRDTIRFGYTAPEAGGVARIGTQEHPIVTIERHTSFVRSLFGKRRAGLERRPPVPFFTVNYDTLLEDALALCRVQSTDGFSGGAMAFWDPDGANTGFDDPFLTAGGCQARVFKLHGSIDWFMSGVDAVVRRREGAGYPPDEPGRLLIYPQATKYQATQKDPFARLFAAFRAALNAERQSVLAICGYSFSDEHVNEEIERALRRRGNQLTVLAFVHEPDSGPAGAALPAALSGWLATSDDWRERVIVAGSRAGYHGSTKPLSPLPAGESHPWWSFDGVADMLANGPEVGS